MIKTWDTNEITKEQFPPLLELQFNGLRINEVMIFLGLIADPIYKTREIIDARGKSSRAVVYKDKEGIETIEYNKDFEPIIIKDARWWIYRVIKYSETVVSICPAIRPKNPANTFQGVLTFTEEKFNKLYAIKIGNWNGKEIILNDIGFKMEELYIDKKYETLDGESGDTRSS